MQILSRKLGLWFASTLLCALVVTGCDDDDELDDIGGDIVDDAVIEGQGRGTDLMILTDQDIGNANQAVAMGVSAHIMITIDEGEILVAEEFLPDCDDDDACEYAERMIDEHSLHIAATEALIADLGVVPMENRVSDALRADVETVIADLRSVDLADVDIEYMRSQVMMHEQSLILVNGLQTHVDDPTFDRFLLDTQATIAAHSAEAQEILRSELDFF